MDPRALRMLQRMGVKVREIKAKRVVIETQDEDIIIEGPQVMETEMAGQISYQVVGRIRKVPRIPEEDVKLVAEKAGASEEEAKKALEETKGDIIEAIRLLRSR